MDGNEVRKNLHLEAKYDGRDGDSKVVELLRKIIKRGNNAEVKGSNTGQMVVYEVKKKKIG